jgi:hypothetical protein
MKATSFYQLVPKNQSPLDRALVVFPYSDDAPFLESPPSSHPQYLFRAYPRSFEMFSELVELIIPQVIINKPAVIQHERMPFTCNLVIQACAIDTCKSFL